MDDRPAALPSEATAVARDHQADRKILKRSVVASACLHLSALLVVLLCYWLSESDLQGKAHDLDITVSFVPLSELETNLPKGVQNPVPAQEPKAAEPATPPKPQPQPKTKPEEKQSAKILEPKKVAPKKTQDEPKDLPPSSDSSQKPNDPPASLNSSTLGVSNGTGDPSEPARISYQDMVATILARAKRYPERALRRHTTGEGTIRIRIAADGDVTAFEIVRSTSSPILDDALQEMVERAAPFPPFPQGLTKDSLSIVVPVSFELQ